MLLSLTNNNSTGACIFEEQSSHNQIVIDEKLAPGHLPRQDPQSNGESRQSVSKDQRNNHRPTQVLVWVLEVSRCPRGSGGVFCGRHDRQV